MNPYWYYHYDYSSKPNINYNKAMDYLSPSINKKASCDYFDLGDPAPNFTLPGIINGKQVNVSLNDFACKWRVLFFYGSDFTFV